MTLELFEKVKLACDLPEYWLRHGDIVKLLDRHIAPDGTKGFSSEAFNAVGETITVTTVPFSALEAIRCRKS